MFVVETLLEHEGGTVPPFLPSNTWELWSEREWELTGGDCKTLTENEIKRHICCSPSKKYQNSCICRVFNKFMEIYVIKKESGTWVPVHLSHGWGWGGQCSLCPASRGQLLAAIPAANSFPNLLLVKNLPTFHWRNFEFFFLIYI